MLFKHLRILCGVPTLVLTSDYISQIGMYNAPPNSEIYYQLAQLVSPSVALPAELVKIVVVLIFVAVHIGFSNGQ